MLYLDNAATTPMSLPVCKAMWQYMINDYGNPSSIYECGRNNKMDQKTKDKNPLFTFRLYAFFSYRIFIFYLFSAPYFIRSLSFFSFLCSKRKSFKSLYEQESKEGNKKFLKLVLNSFSNPLYTLLFNDLFVVLIISLKQKIIYTIGEYCSGIIYFLSVVNILFLL